MTFLLTAFQGQQPSPLFPIGISALSLQLSEISFYATTQTAYHFLNSWASIEAGSRYLFRCSIIIVKGSNTHDSVFSALPFRVLVGADRTYLTTMSV